MNQNLTISGNDLFIGDRPFRLFAGSMHYFRIHPDYWEDRLLQLKSLGCNTVETYVAWNLHEPQEGEWNFAGFADIERFIELASKHGLYLIVRFSPYICAEWENGGIPAWLLKDRNVRLRSRHPRFMQAVRSYYDKIIGVLKPHFSTQGGNIIATQVENEYGCTQNDTRYLQEHLDVLLEKGVDIPIMNCVWANERNMRAAHLDGTHMTLNFLRGAARRFERLEKLVPGSPRICSEFWTGWFSAWDTKRHKMPADPEDIAQQLDELFQADGHPILYMFHGGTNFGFMNGSNIRDDSAQFTITSYDYEAPLGESGQRSAYFHAIKQVAEKHGFKGTPYTSPIPPPAAYPSIAIEEYAPLFENLGHISQAIESPYPLTMEECDQDYGYLLYRTMITGPGQEDRLFINELRDRAHIFIDGVHLETLQRPRGRYVACTQRTFATKAEGSRLDILVENQGRPNFPPFNQEYRGITENVFLNDAFVLSNWQHFPLPMEDLTELQWKSCAEMATSSTGPQPGFYRGWLDIDDEPVDTYIHPRHWQKGCIFINGFNIGRYWNAGPQYSLSIPAPLLKRGRNEIVLFEEEQAAERVDFTDELVTKFR